MWNTNHSVMPVGRLGFLLLPTDFPGTYLPEEALFVYQHN